MNLNEPPPSSFPVHQLKDDYDQQQHYSTYPQNQTIILSNSSSSSVSSYRIQLKNPIEDHKGYYETHNHESQCNKVNSVLKFTLWKQPHHGEKEDQQKMDSSSDLSSNTSPSPYNNTNPIRVCADCTTTKTPLWRSGPKGPKSLCNACGIRQRKARRAMAAAESGDRAAASYRPPAVKIKLRQKEKIGKSGHSPRLKKRCKMAGAATAAGSSSSAGAPRKLNLEDFLISLSRSLSIQRVFPEDEKDAAILLMAISSGLVHG